jgi:hypothetical protein
VAGSSSAIRSTAPERWCSGSPRLHGVGSLTGSSARERLTSLGYPAALTVVLACRLPARRALVCFALSPGDTCSANRFGVLGEAGTGLGNPEPAAGSGAECRLPRVRLRIGHWITAIGCNPPSAWNGSWNVLPDNPSAAGAVSAIDRAISAAGALGARGRTSCKWQASGSNSLTAPSSAGAWPSPPP